MGSSNKRFRTVTFVDGSVAVVQTDPSKPRLLEVVAIFSDASRARNYADAENNPSDERPTIAPAVAPKKGIGETRERLGELSARQRAVLEALRSKMDANKLVEVKATVLATAAKIPLGSLHSVLQSLEKKGLIRTARAGSAKAPAVHQVL